MELFDTLAPILIWVAIGLVGLAILVLLLFGIRGLFYGKAEPLAIGSVVLPIVVLVVLGFVFQGAADSAAQAWAQAGIWTVIIMFGLGLLALLYSGVRGVFS